MDLGNFFAHYYHHHLIINVPTRLLSQLTQRSVIMQAITLFIVLFLTFLYHLDAFLPPVRQSRSSNRNIHIQKSVAFPSVSSLFGSSEDDERDDNTPSKEQEDRDTVQGKTQPFPQTFRI